MATELSVNVNAIALLRNRRDLPWPSVVDLSRIALEAGAFGITVHPRPDERHIRRHDVFDLADLLGQPAFQGREFNIEGYPDERFLALCEEIRPAQVTFVPDDPAQATSDHGWDIPAHEALLRSAIQRLKGQGMRLALFIDPDERVPAFALDVGADRVELFTGPYGSQAVGSAAAAKTVAALARTALAADAIGLGVNAGHDLTVDNVPPLVTAAPMIAELSIGHGLTADALTYGMAASVRRFLKACGKGVQT
ncbi:MAG: pyridoxine 5'-phosphate synthase [Rhizobiales bacterium]|nr:pyridoxine 5'-phosphate synthase [Hyphomicrobiales bacterium]